MNFRRLVSAVAALAVAGTMCAGLAVTASADDGTVVLNWDYSDATETGFSDLGRGATSLVADFSGMSGNSVLMNNSGSTKGSASRTFDAVSATTIGIDFDVYLTGNTTYNKYVAVGTSSLARMSNDDQAPSNAILVVGNSSNGAVQVNGTSTGIACGSWIHVNAIADFTKTTMDVTITAYGGTEALYTGTIDFMDKTITSLSGVSLNSYRGVTDAAIYFNNFTLTTYESTATLVTYYVQYALANGTIIKTEELEGYTGSTAVISTDDFYTSSAKYVYVSVQDDLTIAENETYTVTVSEVSSYTATVTATVDDETIGTYTATAYEGDTATVYYNKYIEDNGIYYVIAQNSAEPYYGVTFSEEGSTSISYSASDVVYAAEIEDLSPSRSYAADGAVPGRYSNGSAKRLYANSYVTLSGWTATEESEATIALWARNQSSSTTGSLSIYILDSEGNLTDTEIDTETWSTSDYGEKSVTVTVPAGSQIVLYNDTAYNSNLEMDYVAITLAPSITATTVTDSTVGTITVADTVYDENGDEVTSSEIEGIDSVQTVYIRIDYEKPSVNPTVTLTNDDEDEATASQDSWYTRVGNSYYFIYQFVNADGYLDGAAVTCGDLSTTIATE